MSIENSGSNVPCREMTAFGRPQALGPTLACTPDSAEKERSRLRAEFEVREKEIAADWGFVAKTKVEEAVGHMQEHIHNVKRDLTHHM